MFCLLEYLGYKVSRAFRTQIETYCQIDQLCVKRWKYSGKKNIINFFRKSLFLEFSFDSPVKSWLGSLLTPDRDDPHM